MTNEIQNTTIKINPNTRCESCYDGDPHANQPCKAINGDMSCIDYCIKGGGFCRAIKEKYSLEEKRVIFNERIEVIMQDWVNGKQVLCEATKLRLGDCAERLGLLEKQLMISELTEEYYHASYIAKKMGNIKKAQTLYETGIKKDIKLKRFYYAAHEAERSGDLRRAIPLYLAHDLYLNRLKKEGKLTESRCNPLHEGKEKAIKLAIKLGKSRLAKYIFHKCEKVGASSGYLAKECGLLERAAELYSQEGWSYGAAQLAKKIGLSKEKINYYEKCSKQEVARLMAGIVGNILAPVPDLYRDSGTMADILANSYQQRAMESQ